MNGPAEDKVLDLCTSELQRDFMRIEYEHLDLIAIHGKEDWVAPRVFQADSLPSLSTLHPSPALCPG